MASVRRCLDVRCSVHVARGRVAGPPVAKTRAPVSETGPPVSETRPPVSETGPPVSETGPAVSETGPAASGPRGTWSAYWPASIASTWHVEPALDVRSRVHMARGWPRLTCRTWPSKR
jgi:hypothetical protein